MTVPSPTPDVLDLIADVATAAQTKIVIGYRWHTGSWFITALPPQGDVIEFDCVDRDHVLAVAHALRDRAAKVVAQAAPFEQGADRLSRLIDEKS